MTKMAALPRIPGRTAIFITAVIDVTPTCLKTRPKGYNSHTCTPDSEFEGLPLEYPDGRLFILVLHSFVRVLTERQIVPAASD